MPQVSVDTMLQNVFKKIVEIWRGAQWIDHAVFSYLFLGSLASSVESLFESELTDNSLTICRTITCPTSLYYYQLIAFMTVDSGLYMIQSNSSLDTFGYIFNSTVRQVTNVSDAFMFNDDGAGNSQFRMTLTLQAMLNYTLMVTTYNAGETGPFSVRAFGGSIVTFSSLWFWLEKNAMIETLIICFIAY